MTVIGNANHQVLWAVDGKYAAGEATVEETEPEIGLRAVAKSPQPRRDFWRIPQPELPHDGARHLALLRTGIPMVLNTSFNEGARHLQAGRSARLLLRSHIGYVGARECDHKQEQLIYDVSLNPKQANACEHSIQLSKT